MAISLLILAGCGRVYQVTSFSYVGDHPGEFPNESLYDEVSITYDFWAENGVMAFTIYNHLHEPVTIDLSRSAFIYDSQTFPYAEGGSYPEESAEAWNGQPLQSGLGQAIVTIPPNASYYLQEYLLDFPQLDQQQVGLDEIINIDQERLPSGVLFRNYLCYYRDGDALYPSYVDDGFMVAETVLAGESAFPRYSNSLSKSRTPAAYHLIKTSTADNVSGTLLLISTLACAIAVSIDDEE